jgi:hypothetical protein
MPATSAHTLDAELPAVCQQYDPIPDVCVWPLISRVAAGGLLAAGEPIGILGAAAVGAIAVTDPQATRQVAKMKITGDFKENSMGWLPSLGYSSDYDTLALAKIQCIPSKALRRESDPFDKTEMQPTLFHAMAASVIRPYF